MNYCVIMFAAREPSTEEKKKEAADQGQTQLCQKMAVCLIRGCLSWEDTLRVLFAYIWQVKVLGSYIAVSLPA